MQKGFPKDAEREFERAINLDKRYYPAWYNLGLVRAARGDEGGARRAFQRTVDHKPGHAHGAVPARPDRGEAAAHATARSSCTRRRSRINPALIEPDVNPRILDTQLIHLALIAKYAKEHARGACSSRASAARPRAKRRRRSRAPSPEAPPAQIVPPAPPATDPSQQTRRPKGN